ncbi:glycosyl transferase family 1 [Sulfobacillus thermotolerans]|uniref:Glycosyl transferase family 1 n=1 Tax=Sulfobacillus thermotolerans TaxID=338644 RepID=A0ABM6RUR7_9FIRM|nr:glycosyl transferase family 1 [Sulfobacillus thermotolerans]
MKIAMDVSIIEQCRTGTEEYVEGLIWGLSRLGTGVVGVGRRGQALLPDQPCLGLASRPKRPLWEKLWWENVSIIKTPQDVDLLHIPYMMYPPVALSIPTVVTVHDVIPYRLSAYHARWKERLYFGQIRKYLPHASQIVAISRATAQDIAELFPELTARVTVIPNGVHPDFFRPVPVEQMERLSSRYRPVRHPRLLYIGGYDPRKNVSTLLKACQQVFARHTGGELVLIGAETDLTIQHQIADLHLQERVVTTPYLTRQEVVALYQTADLFVFPSTYEGFGMPPAQALAMGVPVVAGSTPAVSEVVGDSGLLVPPQDVDAWVQTVNKVLDTPALAQKMAARGRARAEDFNWETVARQYDRLYQRLVP